VSYHYAGRSCPTEDKTDDVKGGFYEELELMFNTFRKYHMKISSGAFKAKEAGNTFLNGYLGMKFTRN
jgi:hypothetical protein